MTPQIAFVLAILAVSLVLFVTERIRMDVVALLVLSVLALSGLVTPVEALSGFSNPAVITVWAMFMISGGLSQTGVAGIIGDQVLRLVGRSEARMVAVIMLTAGGLSAFMNNIGVAALMLPVVMDVARRLGRPPSRLLMPLAYGSLLGGLTTLVGTPPNLLVSQALREGGLEPFALFDFTPVGGAVLIAGVVFVALVGRHLLPARDIGRESATRRPSQLREEYAVEEHMVAMRLSHDSPLVGKSLRDCRLGSATGLNVLSIVRGADTIAAPAPESVLRAGDRLLVEGRLDRLEELRGWRELVIEERDLALRRLVSDAVGLEELRIPSGSPFVGSTLSAIRFRHRFGGIVLAIGRGEILHHSGLADMVLEFGDRLLVQGRHDRLALLREAPEFEFDDGRSPDELLQSYRLEQRLFAVRVPLESVLVGKSLAESRLGDALGLGVLGIERDGVASLLPEPTERLAAGDRLLVRGNREDLEAFRGLQQLEIDDQAPRRLETLQSERTSLAEVILSPRTELAGSTLRLLDFRERYGVQVLAILREGQALWSGLRDVELRFGDALLLFGVREKLQLLTRDPDFVVLTRAAEPVPSRARAAVSALILAGVVGAVLPGWMPISVAAVAGATLMLVTRCLSVDQAYHVIEWRSVFLIAGMLPLGTAMQQTGAAAFLADGVLETVGPLGPRAVLIGLYLVTVAATTIVPTAALVVLMAPIVLKTSAEMGTSPHAMMMAVAVAASASFTSPIAHPANVLVMGPGGYRFVDYVKLGLPLALVVMVVVLLVLPVFWPL